MAEFDAQDTELWDLNSGLTAALSEVRRDGDQFVAAIEADYSGISPGLNSKIEVYADGERVASTADSVGSDGPTEIRFDADNIDAGDALRVAIDPRNDDLPTLDLSAFLPSEEGGEIYEFQHVDHGSAERDYGRFSDEAAAVRRSLRDRADDLLESAGYDADSWNTDARADGTIILQDPETDRTRTIEPDSGESGIDSAVESLDSSSDSSTSDSDSTGGEQDSSPGGGADGLGQVGGIMLVAAIATAVYYGVTQT